MFNTKYSYKNINEYNYLSKTRTNVPKPIEAYTDKEKLIMKELFNKNLTILKVFDKNS